MGSLMMTGEESLKNCFSGRTRLTSGPFLNVGKDGKIIKVLKS